MAEIIYPCILNPDNDCPSSCSSHQKIVDAFKKYAEINKVTVEEAITAMKAMTSLEKTLFSASMQSEKGYGSNDCLNIEKASCRIVFL